MFSWKALLLICGVSCHAEVVQVHVLSRHGARVPNDYTFPSNPVIWPEGPLQQTALGAREGYEMGLRFRKVSSLLLSLLFLSLLFPSLLFLSPVVLCSLLHSFTYFIPPQRYAENSTLLPSSFLNDDNSFYASGVDRVISYAQVFTMGLYPPGTGDAASDYPPGTTTPLPYQIQPMPLRTRESADEVYLTPNTAAKCPTWFERRETLRQSEEWKQQEENAASLFAELELLTGQAPGSITLANAPFGTTSTFKTLAKHNMLSLPVTAEQLTELYSLADYSFSQEYSSDLSSNLLSSPWMKTAVDAMEACMKNQTSKKLYYSSGHANSVQGVLAGLAMDKVVPQCLSP
jgi:hypothetical protein